MSDFHNYSSQLFHILRERNLKMTTAESCTGGLISKIMTDFPGSSEVFWGSFITYSNESKIKVLNVKNLILDSYGAVSEQVVLAMAKGALGVSGADCSVSVSGVAGPGGGTLLKPVGTVWICAALNQGVESVEKFHFSGNRSEIREKTAESALMMLYHLISELYY